MVPIPKNDMYIEFFNGRRSYFPGQQVLGRIVLKLKSGMHIEGMKVFLAGAAIVRLPIVRRTASGLEERDFVEEKKHLVRRYFDLLVGENWIPAGRHVFTFSFTLPEGLPSSFYAEFGAVMYEVIAEIYRKFKPSLLAQGPFTVNALVDLNLDVEAKKSLSVQKDRNLRVYCFFSGGSIGISAELKKQGAVPGEYLDLVVNAYNSSRHLFAFAEMCLYQTAKFYLGRKTQSKTVKLSSVNLGYIQAGGAMETFQGARIMIPSVPPTGLGGCSLMDVYYQVLIALSIPTSRNQKELILTLPIKVGTVPLGEHFNRFVPKVERPPASTNNGRRRAREVEEMEDHNTFPKLTYVRARKDADEERIEKYFPPKPDREVYKLPLKHTDFIPNYACYMWAGPVVDTSNIRTAAPGSSRDTGSGRV